MFNMHICSLECIFIHDVILKLVARDWETPLPHPSPTAAKWLPRYNCGSLCPPEFEILPARILKPSPSANNSTKSSKPHLCVCFKTHSLAACFDRLKPFVSSVEVCNTKKLLLKLTWNADAVSWDIQHLKKVC